MSQRLSFAVWWGIAILWLAGCASSPVQLTLAETPAPAAKLPKATDNALQFNFAPTIDIRPAYQQPNVGRVGGREVVASKLTGWIDRSLQTLHGRRFVVCHDRSANAWLVTPRLRQFYTASVAVSKNANIVLELEIQPPTGPAFTRIYRGRVNAANWWNSAGEIEGSVVNALGDCLDRITRDLDTFLPPEPDPVHGATNPDARQTG